MAKTPNIIQNCYKAVCFFSMHDCEITNAFNIFFFFFFCLVFTESKRVRNEVVCLIKGAVSVLYDDLNFCRIRFFEKETKLYSLYYSFQYKLPVPYLIEVFDVLLKTKHADMHDRPVLCLC